MLSMVARISFGVITPFSSRSYLSRSGREHVLLPLAVVVLRNFLIQPFQHDFRIADDMVVCLNVLVDFGPVDIDMNDFSVTGKRIRLQCHPVREAAADSNQQIAAVYSAVGCLRSVHANHSCRQRIRTVHGTAAHQCDGHRRIHLAGNSRNSS